jgi:alkylhydroperoxidase family enzyme
MTISFLDTPEPPAAAEEIFEADLAELGYVMNSSRLWAYQPETFGGLLDLVGECVSAGGLSFRDRGILVAACASALGDSYCSLAWGMKLAGAAGPETAASVLRGDDLRLTAREQALARWARLLARDPNATTAADVAALREAGYSDARIFAVTVFVALRLALSTANDALGARPDAALGAGAAAVVDAVTFGRAIASAADGSDADDLEGGRAGSPAGAVTPPS